MHSAVVQIAGCLLAVVFGGLEIFGSTVHARVQSPSPASAGGEFEQRIWTKEAGLPDNQVQCLLQCRDGALWIGTKRGLARFDGLRFTVFNRANTPALERDDILFLAEGDAGQVWVSTRSALLIFDGMRWSRFRLRAEPDTARSWRPWPGMNGGMWVTSGSWLCRLGPRGMASYGLADGIETGICGLAEEPGGKLWIGEERSLRTFDQASRQFSANLKPPHLAHASPQIIQRDAQGNLWFAFMEAEALPGADAPKIHQRVFWLADQEWRECPGNPHANDGRPFFLQSDNDGGMWMPAGLGRVVRYRSGQLDYFSLAGEGQKSRTQCALSDREGNLWFGTESGGLQCWTPRKVTAYTADAGLANENIWTICEGSDGSVWVGTDAGVARLSQDRIVTFREQQGLSRKEVRAVAEDQAGTLWVGTMSGLFSLRGEHFEKHEFPGNWVEGKVRTILSSRDGGLWIGTAVGLNRLLEGKRTKYTVADGLAHEDVRVLLEDRAGNLWIGTAGGGLQRLRDGSFTTFTSTNGLNSENVWALHEDANGVLWIGTDRGLNRLERDRFTSITVQQGLPDNLINCILEDAFRRLWFSHDRGIYWVWKSELDAFAAGRRRVVRCINYDDSDGLPSLETNGQKSNPAGCKTRDGRLWFPTTRGVAVIDPRKTTFDEVPPLAALEQVRANGRLLLDAGPQTGVDATPGSSITPDSYLEELARPDSPSPAFNHRLAPGGARVLEFRYTANGFAAPAKTRFRYRLLGLDDHWIEAGTRREAHFIDLRPGDYQFEVIAGDHRGVWSAVPATFGFRLAPFIYQTWWFYLGCGGGAAALVVGFVFWRIQEVRKIHRLEAISALSEQRKHIARDIHDEIGASLTQIVRLSESAERHPTFSEAADNPTRRIATVAEAAVNHLGEIVWANNPKYDTLQDLVAYLREYAANYLAAAAIEVRFQFPERVDRRPVHGLFRRHVLLLLKESLHNIAKHAKASLVVVTLTLAADRLELRIRDNGRGLPGGAGQDAGNGMTNMRQRAAELKGKLEFRSPAEGGTEIWLLAPLPAS